MVQPQRSIFVPISSSFVGHLGFLQYGNLGPLLSYLLCMLRSCIIECTHSPTIVFLSYITVNRHQAAQKVNQCRPAGLDSIAVSVFIVILVEFYKYYQNDMVICRAQHRTENATSYGNILCIYVYVGGKIVQF